MKDTRMFKSYNPSISKEDDYISTLKRQVYLLELEMKQMKDKELDTKKKVRGYEVLFRDGVPLNEHFLALKTKYTKEKENFENLIDSLSSTIESTEENNQHLLLELKQTEENYFSLIKRFTQESSDFAQKLFDINNKLYFEENKLIHLRNEKTTLDERLLFLCETSCEKEKEIEKENLFKEEKEEQLEKEETEKKIIR